MRLLHTSDWHLGKKLENQTRIEEQKEFISQLSKIIDEKNIDIVIIAGDIYDTYNPSAEAEKLFFDSLKTLSKDGKVGIIIIAGNHDNPKRLDAISELAKDYGVIICTSAFQELNTGKYGSMNIYKSNKGGFFVEKSNKKIYFYCLPYPSEQTLNENLDEISFRSRIKEILKEGVERNDEEIPTVVISHLYVAGSMGEGDSSLELGGTRAISLSELPNADYIALGHVHRPIEFKDKNAYYSGSPLEYRVTENRFNKKVFIVEFKDKMKTIEPIYLKNNKPIKEYFFDSINEALKANEKLMRIDEWIYLNIKLDKPLKNSELKELKANKNILEIIPKIITENSDTAVSDESETSLTELFIKFYKEDTGGLEPTSEILSLFSELLEEGNNETN